jgi:hypothetical protein
MSCNICHTPILVSKQFLDPNDMETVTQTDHLDPIVQQVCPAKTHQPYFRTVIHLDRRMEGLVGSNPAHCGKGLFLSGFWKIMGGCALALKQEDISDGLSSSSVYPIGFMSLILVERCSRRLLEIVVRQTWSPI